MSEGLERPAPGAGAALWASKARQGTVPRPPIALGFRNDGAGVWTSCFMRLFVRVGLAPLWMRFAIRRMARARFADMPNLPKPPEWRGMGQAPAAKS